MFHSLDEGQSAPPWLPPPGAGLLLRALLKRPGPRTAQSGPLGSAFLAGVGERDGLAAYNAALGFAPGSTPLTWYYLMVQRAHLATMLAPAFPYRIAGMVHVANTLALHGAPAPGPLRLVTRLAILPPSDTGAVHCALETEGRCDDRLVFSCSSDYLAVRGTRRAGPAPVQAQAPAAPAAPLGEWTLAPSAGRAYARVSGDWNPIHLAGWSARLMGLREPIIHGMHSVGKACALLERHAGQPVSAVSVRFKAPIPLGASVVLARGAAPDSYALYCRGRVAAEGSFRLGLPAPD